MDINEYFDNVNIFMVNRGVDVNKADDKASIMTEKKFNTKK
jgi:hypothetical protein